ncbi:MAG: SLC13 family permease [Coriobacteriia bacterium]|nr:SLC13 family permease [Coriobacteriia bacterium]
MFSTVPHIRRKQVFSFFKDNAVCLISGVVAAVTVVFVPPSLEYLSYINWNTLGCIFCILAVVTAAKREGLFDVLARGIVRHFSKARSTVCALVAITLVGSMFVTNDMALIMFLPLSAMVLFRAGEARLVPFCFVMQSVAANLGGMIVPFGSPHNLFLFSHYGISMGDFVRTMLPPFVLSVVLIALACLVFVHGHAIEVKAEGSDKVDRKRAATYAVLFAFTLLGVFRVIPIGVAVAIVAVVLLAIDRKALAEVDYGLLLTFVFFFVFSGNMARIPAVGEFFGQLLSQNALLCAALASQVLSNVPIAVLFSQFTSDWAGLLIGVNVGGVGTLVASLASIIALDQFRAIQKHGLSKEPEVARKFTMGYYLGLFTAVNFAFLVVLLGACLFIGY